MVSYSLWCDTASRSLDKPVKGEKKNLISHQIYIQINEQQMNADWEVGNDNVKKQPAGCVLYVEDSEWDTIKRKHLGRYRLTDMRGLREGQQETEKQTMVSFVCLLDPLSLFLCLCLNLYHPDFLACFPSMCLSTVIQSNSQ